MDPMESIKQTYFVECDELLADLESGLLALESDEGDSDTINAVFRAVHSVKGGAGAFGFEALVEFAHVFESTLDAMRSGTLAVDNDNVKIMLRAADVLADLVQAAKDGSSVDPARTQTLADELSALITPQDGAPVTGDDGEPAADSWGFTPLKLDIDEPAAPSRWILTVTPTPAAYAKGHDPAILLREVARLGDVECWLDASALPDLNALDPEGSYLRWTVFIDSAVEETAIRDVFDFVGEDCPITLDREAPADQPLEDIAPPPAADFDVAALISLAQAQSGSDPAMPSDEPAAAPKAADHEESGGGREPSKQAAAGATIRVDLERVDRLIDLVGELVINQAMIAQRVVESELGRSSSVAIGLDELEQLTREIQDSVMAIRAQPVKSVFQRMPRLVREVAGMTNKSVRLVTEGEGTEVDKTVIERLSDPITHMLRNAIDHGVETPDERVAAGKPAEGVVRLSASHRSGRIVIEVADDGKGINRPRVREIAINKGVISPDANLTDDEIDNLIFAPGFSTASTVSNISGRGVGMDVVKRSIQALGGRISIASVPGRGSTFTMSLPLTLAVLDGMVVTVGDQTLVSPLTAIVETLRPKPTDIRLLGPKGAVLAVRGAHVPLIDIGVALGWRDEPIPPANGVILLVESEVGGRAALVVDQIQGQRQVVIKSLEQNFQHVDGVAAATILGDGRVALILDVDAVIAARSRDRFEPQPLAQAS
ncbi:MAG: chemotaxis protein CheA [Alphaproteobacteria bacterium]|nr:chemotaxis protein CheA [Alphaproteobacteria bacterium]